MKRAWFKTCGWFHYPVSLAGGMIFLAALAFCVQVFWAIDRRSHSVSDTLYGIFPVFSCCFLLYDWVASKAGHDPG